MAHYDEKSGKLRPDWTIRFSAWQTFLGSAIAGVVCGLVLVFQLVTGPGLDALSTAENVLQGVILILGMSLGLFLLIGPTLAWGLGFSLRQVTNQSLHVIAFGILGVFLGFSIGGFVEPWVGISGFASALAPAMGLGAAVGRWVLSPHAKV